MKGAKRKRKKDLRITIGTDAQGDQVLIEFSKSVIIAAFDPDTAIKIARSLLQAADDLKQNGENSNEVEKPEET